MASLREYCEMLSTSQLQAILREDCEGRGNLTLDAILLICGILAERNTSLPPLADTVHEICRNYLDS